MAQMINVKDAKDYIMANYPNDPLLKHIAVSMLDQLPKVEATEVVHSPWDTVFYERNGSLATYSHLCPKCKYFYRDAKFKGHNYCPNCGTKLDVEVTNGV